MIPGSLLSAIGVLGAVIAIMADGRRAVAVAVAAAGVGLLPAVAVLAIPAGPLVLAAAIILSLGAAWTARRAAGRLRWVAGLDPLVPAFAPSRELFGPRSVRAVAAGLAIPAASWVSFNVPVGEITAVSGVLFPMAYTWVCGALRLVVARTVEDLCAGVAMIGLAAAATWFVRGGDDVLLAIALAALAPLSTALAGWLSGRHERRPQEAAAAEAAS